MSAKAQTIPTSPVKSSQIAELGHDPATNTMAIRFPSKTGSGSLYHYSNVTAEDFEKFLNAESIGRHFGQVFKPNVEKYPHKKINESAE